jgi:hypothetical protein
MPKLLPQHQVVEIAAIRTRKAGNLSCRAREDQQVVDDYADAIARGEELPPVVLFKEADVYWLADGRHRLQAASQAGHTTIKATVRIGTRRDAILAAAGAHAKHGLPRTADDKRRAVRRLLEDAEWSRWSDNAIARHCSVSNHFVTKERAHLGTIQDATRQLRTRLASRNGTTYTIDTTNIRRKRVDPTVLGVPAVDEAPAPEDAEPSSTADTSADDPFTGGEESPPLVIAKARVLEQFATLGERDQRRLMDYLRLRFPLGDL